MSFYGGKQKIPLNHDIEFIAVENVPRYHLRTDLPTSSNLVLYDGEIHDFTIWITNSGDIPITSLNLSFEENENVAILEEPVLPILSSSQVSIKCQITADRDIETLVCKVVTSCGSSECYCSQVIKQRMIIQDSLNLKRIFMMKTAPPYCATKDLDDIYVGYEIENLAKSTFQYNAVVSDTKVAGLLGASESVLVVASYSTSELKSDGSDAEKRRVIALTRFMEEKQGERIRPEQRIKAAKVASIMQKLESKWNFDWAVSSTRRGKLRRRVAAIDDDLYQGIESGQIKANITLTHPQVKCNEIIELCADFGTDLIKECELAFNSNSNVLWEGELHRQSDAGASSYTFVLCFGEPGSYMLKLLHRSCSGVSGYTPATITVAE